MPRSKDVEYSKFSTPRKSLVKGERLMPSEVKQECTAEHKSEDRPYFLRCISASRFHSCPIVLLLSGIGTRQIE